MRDDEHHRALKILITPKGAKDSAAVILRRPEIEELLVFMKGHSLGDTSVAGRTMRQAERARFFDVLLVSVENLESDDGEPITLETRHLIPAWIKNRVIADLYDGEPAPGSIRKEVGV